MITAAAWRHMWDQWSTQIEAKARVDLGAAWLAAPSLMPNLVPACTLQGITGGLSNPSDLQDIQAEEHTREEQDKQ